MGRKSRNLQGSGWDSNPAPFDREARKCNLFTKTTEKQRLINSETDLIDYNTTGRIYFFNVLILDVVFFHISAPMRCINIRSKPITKFIHIWK